MVKIDGIAKVLQAVENLAKGQEGLMSRADKTDKLLQNLNSRADNSEKMIRTVINGQSSLKQELLSEIGKVETKLSMKISEVKSEVIKNRKRIDKFGLDLAELSDDSPTIAEFEKLESRVSSLEKVNASA